MTCFFYWDWKTRRPGAFFDGLLRDAVEAKVRP